MPSEVRMTTSALSPAAMDLRSACVAWNCTRSPGAASSSAPFMASVLSTERSKGGFDGDIDVIGASVHVAEELGAAERAGAVRYADPDIGLARDPHVDARVEVVEQLPVAAAAPALVAQLHLADLLRVGQARAHAEAGVNVAVPGKLRPVRLEESHHRPQVVAVALLEMALQADEAGEVDRPAASVLDQLAPDVHRGDVSVVDGMARRARKLHGLRDVAIARVAVERLDDQRLGRWRPARLFRRKIVEETDERLALQPALGERAIRDLARAARRGERAEEVPALGQRVAGVERRLKVDPGIGLVRRRAVIEVVQL